MTTAGIPVIELSGLGDDPAGHPAVAEIAAAGAASGFFQIVGHGISEDMVAHVWDITRRFFALPADAKRSIMRTKENSRGFYDRELTKQRRDQKEVFDFATVPFPDLPHGHPENFAPVDGHNQWPDAMPEMQAVLMGYLAACEDVALRVLGAFAAGFGVDPAQLRTHFGRHNTSFIRLNHYPLTDPLTEAEAESLTPLGDMALHHHTDSGALTLLLQDEVGGLQVEAQGQWIDVPPIPGALVVNTGDMMQVWSNDRYQAALHRVQHRTDRARYSLPYFFNPSYNTSYAPLTDALAPGERSRYRSINWGDFRQARADGDFADYGAEVQIADFRID